MAKGDVILKADIPRAGMDRQDLKLMRALAREQTLQIFMRESFTIVRSPVVQLIAGFTAVEYLQRKNIIPGMAGNMLELALVGAEAIKGMGGGAGMAQAVQGLSSGFQNILQGLSGLLLPFVK